METAVPHGDSREWEDRISVRAKSEEGWKISTYRGTPNERVNRRQFLKAATAAGLGVAASKWLPGTATRGNPTALAASAGKVVIGSSQEIINTDPAVNTLVNDTNLLLVNLYDAL